SSLDFGCEAEIMRLAGGDGRAEPQRNRGQKAARSDAEASREKLLQRTHELRRERAGDHPHGFASAGQSPGEGKQTRRRGGVLQRHLHASVCEGRMDEVQTTSRPTRDASSPTNAGHQQAEYLAKIPSGARKLRAGVSGKTERAAKLFCRSHTRIFRRPLR